MWALALAPVRRNLVVGMESTDGAVQSIGAHQTVPDVGYKIVRAAGRVSALPSVRNRILSSNIRPRTGGAHLERTQRAQGGAARACWGSWFC